jgi:hypothetical protein
MAAQMKVCFLLDENASKAQLQAIRQLDPGIDLLRVGDAGAPARGTLDPEILLYCVAERRALLTRNRESMPIHIANHFAQGRHQWGVFRLRPGYSYGEYAVAIHSLWSASDAEQWIDRDEYIPW